MHADCIARVHQLQALSVLSCTRDSSLQNALKVVTTVRALFLHKSPLEGFSRPIQVFFDLHESDTSESLKI